MYFSEMYAKFYCGQQYFKIIEVLDIILSPCGNVKMSVYAFFITVFVIVFASLITVAFLFRRRIPVPPLSREIKLSNFFDGSIIRILYEESQKMGLVFRFQLPLLRNFIVVADGCLASKILEGDKLKGFLPADKSDQVKKFNKLFFGCPNIFTKKTIGEGWEWARKTIAPEFSMANISKSIPKLHINLGKLEEIMHKNCEEGTSFDIAKLMMQFTLDFILAALFKLNYDSMRNHDSIGNTLLREIEIAAMEYGIKQYTNFLRGYMFWDKEVVRAKNALIFIEAYIKNLIAEYKSSKTDDEIKSDDSLLGRLLRRCPIIAIHFNFEVGASLTYS